ncbi:class 3 adenylate cyclase [Neolewinella xylanilytica]|uniref:Class 3 adenylate cyclase n=1 Tax=Neolewinella xylanilytica TaxID=1514080 RepID=A0A2S6I3M1_9BACT|nr:adenylate/guanylate cyclase domain-containing protein [Neolewinella xylanilytica]PPK85765.1 class 3 adenylate cyclase [Neolewinella xylanilytica]
MHRTGLLLLLLYALIPGLARAQSTYEGQITVIRDMIERRQYTQARIQSEALIEAGRQQRLDEVEGYGHYLLGRVLLQNPDASSKSRVEGIQELRLASRRFGAAGQVALVDSISVTLERLVAANPGDYSVPALPAGSVPLVTPTPEALDETALNAIVALQSAEIEALNDSQLRQLLRIQQQDIALDSFKFQVLNDSFRLMRQQMQLEEQRSLTREEVQRRNFFIVLALGILVALALLYLRYRSSQRYQVRIRDAQQRSDELLLNILPQSVARELKDTGKATARRYEQATVMFSDFEGFSRIASSLDPEQLVADLDRTFRAFDEIVERHGLEKIKTIGDAYMCVGGVPEADPDNAARAVRAAIEIQDYLSTQDKFRARIGIHSGPVVAGVVGRDKFAYDIWGDTVNQAARLEAAGKPGEVTLSRITCELLGDDFDCELIGTFTAKNIGEMDRYRVRSSRLTKNPS